MTVVKFPNRAVGRRRDRLARAAQARPKIRTVFDADLSDEHWRHVYRLRGWGRFNPRRHEMWRYLYAHVLDIGDKHIDLRFDATVNDKPVPDDISEVLLEWFMESQRLSIRW